MRQPGSEPRWPQPPGTGQCRSDLLHKPCFLLRVHQGSSGGGPAVLTPAAASVFAACPGLAPTRKPGSRLTVSLGTRGCPAEFPLSAFLEGEPASSLERVL